MLQVFLIALAVWLFFPIVVLLVAGAVIAARRRLRVPPAVILELDLTRGVAEQSPESPLARVMRRTAPEIRTVIETLGRAAADRRVVGLVGRIGSAPLRMAEVQELRNAVESFRQSGKPTMAFAETFGEYRPGNGAYYLATAFDTVYTQPSGDIGLTGLVSETPFVHNALDKVGIVPRLDARAEYKNFRNIFTETGYTQEHREANQAVMISLYDQILTGVAERRGLDKEKISAAVDRAPLSPEEALRERLIDGAVYWDDVYERMRERTGTKAEPMDLVKYRRRISMPRDTRAGIAYICVTGSIVTGESRRNPMSGDLVTGSETVVSALRSATENRRVKAVVLRVSSPGGSYVASDAIRAAVERTRKAGKPVVVTMGAVAASGGYFVSMGADKVIAQPGTLTGSIGVVGGKMVVKGLTERLGLTFDEVHTGKNALMSLPTHDYTDEQWRHTAEWLDRVYDDFVAKVSQGRELPVEHVRQVARGRVWSGEDARSAGLVDLFGGIPEAIASARELAGIPPKAPLSLTILPKRPTVWVRLLRTRPQTQSAGGPSMVLARMLESLVGAPTSSGGFLESPGPLLSPPEVYRMCEV